MKTVLVLCLVLLLGQTTAFSQESKTDNDSQRFLMMTPVARPLDATLLATLIPELQADQWTPKQFFAALSEKVGNPIAISSEILRENQRISAGYRSKTFKNIMDHICVDRKWIYDFEHVLETDVEHRRATLNILMIRVHTAKEDPPMGTLRAIKSIRLINVSPDDALQAALKAKSPTGIVYMSTSSPHILVEDDPEWIGKVKQAIVDADEDEVTRVVSVTKRTPEEIVAEIEKLLPDQEGQLIPDAIGGKIYLQDTQEMADKLEKLIHELDSGAPVGTVRPTSRTVRIRNAAAEQVAADLLRLMPELTGIVKADLTENTITITGDPSRWDALERLIQGLDDQTQSK
ncbi:MAG TPA: secretin N-terminal domain-containing protein, partial [bacterium]|nr:secretin N-terminal domain-containing protein [bacterium]